MAEVARFRAVLRRSPGLVSALCFALLAPSAGCGALLGGGARRGKDQIDPVAAARNALGRLTVARNATARVLTRYDARGRSAESEVVLSLDPSTTYFASAAYDALDRTTASTFEIRKAGGPVDREVVSHGYADGGGLGRIDSDRAGNVRSILKEVRRDAHGRTELKLYGNDVRTEYAYDTEGTQRLQRIASFDAGGSKIQELAYAFDADGNIETLSQIWAMGAETKSFDLCGPSGQTCSYDALHRITRSGAGAYAYDRVGNLTGLEGRQIDYLDPAHAHAPSAASATADVASATYAYDANGSLVERSGGRTIEWNGFGKPRTISQDGAVVGEYAYGPGLGRIWKREAHGAGSRETIYVGHVEIRAGAVTRYYFAGSDRVAEMAPDGAVFYRHGDHLGSSNVVTDGAGAVVRHTAFAPYGRAVRQADTGGHALSHTFTDKEEDASGYLDFGARLYDPSIGRFVAADPLGVSHGEPVTLNRYAYAHDNPLVLHDPTGHFAWVPVILAAVAFGASFIPNTVVRNIITGIATGGVAPFLEGMGRGNPWMARAAGLLLAFAGGYQQGWVSFDKPAQWLGLKGLQIAKGAAAGLVAAAESAAVSFLPGKWSGIYGLAHSAFNDAQDHDQKWKDLSGGQRDAFVRSFTPEYLDIPESDRNALAGSVFDKMAKTDRNTYFSATLIMDQTSLPGGSSVLSHSTFDSIVGMRANTGSDKQFRLYGTIDESGLGELRSSKLFKHGSNKGLGLHGEYSESHRLKADVSLQMSVNPTTRAFDADVDFYTGAGHVFAVMRLGANQSNVDHGDHWQKLCKSFSCR